MSCFVIEYIYLTLSVNMMLIMHQYNENSSGLNSGYNREQ